MKDPSMAECNFLSNKVEIDFYMFCSLMLHWIAGEIYCTDVITVDNGGSTERQMKLNQQLSQPSRLGDAISHGVVLSFSTRARDRVLTLRRPGYQVIT